MERKMREAAFLSPLLVEQMTETDWVLTTDFRYFSVIYGGTIVVPADFTTDFASVPRWPFIYWMAGGEAVRPAVVHDFLYRTNAVPRPEADAVFREAMGVIGTPWWRKELMWLAVRVFGGDPYKNGPACNAANSGRSNTTAYNLRKLPPPKTKALTAAKSPTIGEYK